MLNFFKSLFLFLEGVRADYEVGKYVATIKATFNIQDTNNSPSIVPKQRTSLYLNTCHTK